ncbi:hypothetical protein HDU79_006283 [Rhizoclosmatium sp. JEL0117]|nr:hypothetical protein HDU79_006283 [Rhizoclosmatium sp. JEL0117]
MYAYSARSFIYADAAAREAGDKKFFTDLIKNRDPLKIKVNVTDDIGAVAVWEHKSTDLTEDAAYPSIEGIKPEAEQLFALVDKNEPPRPFLYLAFVGAAAKGTGAGSALIRHGLEQAKPGERVALFTSIGSVPFYERFGFKVTTTMEVQGFSLAWMIKYE